MSYVVETKLGEDSDGSILLDLLGHVLRQAELGCKVQRL